MYLLSTVSVVTLTLMLSLTEVTPTPDECVHLNSTLSAADLHTIFGKWILHEAYTNNDDYFSHFLKTTNSAQTEFIPAQNNHTVIFKQANVRDETCTRYSFNFTVVGNTIQRTSTAHNFTSEADFLKTCDDFLLMRYSTVQADGKKATHLLFYGKTQTLPQEDHEKAKKQAKCLGFLQPPVFAYKQAELCPEKSDATKAKEEPEQ